MNLKSVQPTQARPTMDMCSCPKCGWEGQVAECERERESEGWEYPEYWIHICPKCGEVCEEYWYSDEAIAELERLDGKFVKLEG